ncbi:related to SPS19-peroxisomal 2,4-dienoyl-CoA reductase [Sporisorium reilianum SRZ2]|uniref:2,4-dienoyl-CoA reductase [(3E)-enoyl-CoA-producing] n=2 Tax=Sporisorium reilianum TaxID=72558 RepID=E6ZYN7_SPORE|nr:related to SPS19-peroxisomal 2,4-dienoyl-CoA reductase [Sporisorium reilianum SRZ2]SJX62205.1 related to SPS19-peroxisomal 2,4-dienoyl-CoA reductase [Sporisorium reilianum f. sp. reilianum]
MTDDQDTSRAAVVLAAADPAKIFRADLFKGKVLFCTGGGSGICYEITKSIMSFGANAAILGRKADRLARAAKDLAAATGSECLDCPADVRDPEQLKAAVRKTIEKFGRIDFVIAGSAANWLAGIEQNNEKGFKTVIDIDLIGSYNTVKATLEQVTKNRGSFIFISATLHYFGLPWQSHASAAKAGVDALSRVLAVEMGPLGVRSNVIAPGPIGDTEGMDRLAPKGAGDAIADGIPMQRMGAKSDIAAAAVFLFSDAATYVTGTQMVVDGAAWHVQGPMLPYPTTSLDPKSLSSIVTGSRL